MSDPHDPWFPFSDDDYKRLESGGRGRMTATIIIGIAVIMIIVCCVGLYLTW